MSLRRRALVLWAAFAFVTWNVVFDRGVADAARAFARDQIVRHQQGAPLDTLDAGFSPHVLRSALKADLYAAAVLLVGAGVTRWARLREDRRRGVVGG